MVAGRDLRQRYRPLRSLATQYVRHEAPAHGRLVTMSGVVPPAEGRSGPGLRRRSLALVGPIVLAVVVGALSYWAGMTAVVPPQLPVASHATQTYVAEIGTIGRRTTVAVTAAWRSSRTVLGNIDGVVTAVRHKSGEVAHAGDVVATVALRPVVVATGSVPAFRALRKGLRGPDVRQFQQLLRTDGFLKRRPSGRFDAATVAATKRWQRSLHIHPDGIVEAGDLVFVGRLPARLLIVPSVGDRTTVGSEFLRVLQDVPTFRAIVTSSARAELRTGMAIEISTEGSGSWFGVLGTFTANDDGTYSSWVSGSLCGADCGSLPVTGDTQLSGTVVIVPPMTGVVVPVSALSLTAAGGTTVTLVDGQGVDVAVASQTDGFAIVTGLGAGTPIRLPAAPSQ